MPERAAGPGEQGEQVEPGEHGDRLDQLDRGNLPTERTNPASAGLDELTIQDAVDVMIAEDRSISEAVDAAREDIAAAVELVSARLAAGGHLLYVGAGTSGRLGALDAAECPPTFRTPPELVQAAIAGGPDALLRAVEGAEDSAEAGREAVARHAIGPRDVVVGITAGGTTPFVHAALAEAKTRAAATVFFACVPRSAAPDDADVSIRVVTGPEVLAGSTRLKAGTATKMVLNMLTTLTMARLGKVHGNLMVDVDTRANTKLVDRGQRLVARIADVPRPRATELLERANGEVKLAILLAAGEPTLESARQRLRDHGDVLRQALASRETQPRRG